jgi:hypothetical protein
MAGRILNRRELRRQSAAAESASAEGAEDEAEAVEEDEEDAEEGEEAAEGSEEEGDEEAPATKVKGKAKPKAVRKTRKPKAAPRMRARWGVFDSSMKQVAVFDYKDRAAAEAKVAELQATRKTGTFFVQMVKEPMAEDAASAPAAEDGDWGRAAGHACRACSIESGYEDPRPWTRLKRVIEKAAA